MVGATAPAVLYGELMNKNELLEKAKRLGVPADGRWGEDRLKKAIEETENAITADTKTAEQAEAAEKHRADDKAAKKHAEHQEQKIRMRHGLKSVILIDREELEAHLLAGWYIG